MEGRVMGIYIKGFKPQDGLYVIKDGVIRKYKEKGGTVRPYELVEVKEPHGRLIDADALLKRWCSEVCKAKPRCDEDCMFYDYLTIDSLSPTIEPEPHWISCSERLPREEEQDDELGVLVTLGNGYSGLQCDWYHGDHWYDWDGFVVAWMPLPPIYQGITSK